MQRTRIIVKGLVQEVYFRAFTKETADRLGLSGWVRNLPDSSVEAVAEGEENALKKFVSALKTGPAASRVEGVEVLFFDAAGEFKMFEIRR